ncbi:MAG: hypothetical protein KatS3mg110_2111 [Pirellulaceae bacterium]|nr:MAG: hypothetical protein KatS3mg110_2111 [Pirellulaceae bacterium]
MKTVHHDRKRIAAPLMILVGPLLIAGQLMVSHTELAAQSSLRPPEGLRDKPVPRVALVNLRLVVAPGQVIEKGTLLINGRYIEAVGADVPVPADATRIDMNGKTAYPGLIDAYSEAAFSWNNDQGAPYWNAEIRPQLSVASLYQTDAATDEARRRQGITVRLLAPQGGIFKGRSALVTTAGHAADRAILKPDVALHVRLTIPFGRPDRSYPNSPMGAVALARQAMYDARWYELASQHRGFSGDQAPETNDALNALLPYLHQEGLVVIDAPNELFCLRAAKFAAEFQLRYLLRGSGNEYRRLEAIRALGVPILVPIDFPSPPNVTTPEAALSTTLEQMLHWDLAPENPARLVAAGVPIALTTDGLRSLKDFWSAVRKAVRRGLDADEALRALTLRPAELFGVSDRLGTLAAGKYAHLVIADGDLFKSDAKVLETWIDGERFRFDTPPPIDPRGRWLVRAKSQRKLDGSLWAISGTLERLAGEIRLPAAAEGENETVVKLDRVGMQDERLGATFPAAAFGYDGTARLSVLLEQAADKPARWTGFVEWPDGSRTPVEAQRQEAAAETPAQPAQDTTKSEAPQRALFEVNYPLGAYGHREPPEQPERLLFTGATIWTCGPEGILKNASLLIGEGRILAVGRHIPVPPGAVVIDLQGKHITPGIIDCHSHMATDGGVNESGQAVTAEVRIEDFLDCDDISIYRQLAGGVTAANILHGSANPIGGQNQVIKLRWGALPEELKFREAPPGIKFALGENVKRSNSPTPSTRYPQSRMGVEQIIRDTFQAAREYRQKWQQWLQNPAGPPPRRDLELDAIAEVLEGKRWVHCHSYRQDEIVAFLRVLEDFQVTVGTLQHILEGYKVADVLARHGATASAFADWWAYKFEVYDAIPYNGALMHRAGVVVSFNSDDRELARHLNHEAAKAIKYGGVSPEEALKFVTLNPARQLRIDQWVGSLEPGKHADFVIWSGPPLSTLSRCEQTWIDGRKYFDREEDRLMQQEVQRMRNALIQKILQSGETPRSESGTPRDDSHLWPRDDEFCAFHADE